MYVICGSTLFGGSARAVKNLKGCSMPGSVTIKRNCTGIIHFFCPLYTWYFPKHMFDCLTIMNSNLFWTLHLSWRIARRLFVRKHLANGCKWFIALWIARGTWLSPWNKRGGIWRPSLRVCDAALGAFSRLLSGTLWPWGIVNLQRHAMRKPWLFQPITSKKDMKIYEGYTCICLSFHLSQDFENVTRESHNHTVYWWKLYASYKTVKDGFFAPFESFQGCKERKTSQDCLPTGNPPTFFGAKISWLISNDHWESFASWWLWSISIGVYFMQWCFCQWVGQAKTKTMFACCWSSQLIGSGKGWLTSLRTRKNFQIARKVLATAPFQEKVWTLRLVPIMLVVTVKAALCYCTFASQGHWILGSSMIRRVGVIGAAGIHEKDPQNRNIAAVLTKVYIYIHMKLVV